MKRHILYGFIVVLLLSSCAQHPKQAGASITSVAGAPVPTLSYDDIMADALRQYDAGEYEGAIISYNAAIKIEPKSYDAHFGLGRSYRGAKKADEAVKALETARTLRKDEDERDLVVELGYAYVECGMFEQAELVALPLWENDAPDMDAGMVLLMAFAAQEQMDDVMALMENEALAQMVSQMGEGDALYFGPLNESGDRHGRGIGFYPGGFVYSGDYVDGMRIGQGIWIAGSNGYYIGAWDNDSPNGYGELYRNTDAVNTTFYFSGEYQNGLEHGKREHRYNDDNGVLHIVEYSCENGHLIIIGTSIELGAIFGYDQDGNAHGIGVESTIWGIAPWTNIE